MIDFKRFIKAIGILNNSDQSKAVEITSSNSSTTNTKTTIDIKQNGNRTISTPNDNVSSDFVLTESVQSLTNKQVSLSNTTDNKLLLSEATSHKIVDSLITHTTTGSDVTLTTPNELTITNVKTNITNDLDVLGDVTIGGDLQINGNLTYVNTTNLEVSDSNIVLNKNGTDVSAQGAGITIERDGTNGSLVYDSSLSSKFKVGDISNEEEILTTGHIQTITEEKTFDNYINFTSVDDTSTDTILTIADKTVTRITGNKPEIRQITNLSNGSFGILFNVSGVDITFFHEDITVPASNRIVTPTGVDFIVRSGNPMFLYRDAAENRTKLVLSPGFTSTDELPEGSVNLYFTDTRAQAALASDLSNKANVTLNNLSTTSINADLLPSGTRALGSSLLQWNNLFASSITVGTGSFSNSLLVGSNFTLPDGVTSPANIATPGTLDLYAITQNNSIANTRNINILSGNALSTFNSGNIKIKTGSVATGTRGSITLDANSIINSKDNDEVTSVQFVKNQALTISVSNQAVVTTDKTSYSSILLKYSATVGSSKRTGTLLVAVDSSNVAVADNFVETVPTSLKFDANLVGSTITITQTNTEASGSITISYEITRFKD